MAGRSLFAASVAASIFSLASAAAVLRRNDYPPLPPCSYPFTPFDYIGCYTDTPGQTRALDFSAGVKSENMTVEFCTATCKCKSWTVVASFPKAWPERLIYLYFQPTDSAMLVLSTMENASVETT